MVNPMANTVINTMVNTLVSTMVNMMVNLMIDIVAKSSNDSYSVGILNQTMNFTMKSQCLCKQFL